MINKHSYKESQGVPLDGKSYYNVYTRKYVFCIWHTHALFTPAVHQYGPHPLAEGHQAHTGWVVGTHHLYKVTDSVLSLRTAKVWPADVVELLHYPCGATLGNLIFWFVQAYLISMSIHYILEAITSKEYTINFIYLERKFLVTLTSILDWEGAGPK